MFVNVHIIPVKSVVWLLRVPYQELFQRNVLRLKVPRFGLPNREIFQCDNLDGTRSNLVRAQLGLYRGNTFAMARY